LTFVVIQNVDGYYLHHVVLVKNESTSKMEHAYDFQYYSAFVI